MTAHVFIGPTLAAEEARAIWPDAVYMPPVRQGDVYRVVTRLRPDAVGIVDGYFAHVPSVWHKEILYALAEGIPVYGSASMGALRAAELAQFGMVGVGAIFEAYQTGLGIGGGAPFEDDDEVAVLHGPAETGYVALSEALVNVRWTFAEAAAQDVIAPATRDGLVATGKALFYQERSYDVILARARGRVPDDEVERLRAWLPDHKINQKRIDAIAMLRAMRDRRPAPLRVRYTLAETTYWEAAREAVDAEGATSTPELDELRLQGAPYLAARARALAGLLQPDREPACPDMREPRSCAEVEFMALQERLDRATRRRAHERLAERVPTELLERHILAELRSSDARLALLQRAEQKRGALGAGRHTCSISSEDLIAWYFRTLGAPVPADLDAYARALDFPSTDSFRRSVLDEYLFVSAWGARAEGAISRVRPEMNATAPD
jgi:hypothetical protein